MVLKMHNLTPSAFADKIGVQRSALSHVLTGRNKPGLDFLEKILNNFPRVNAHWLITGNVSSTADVEQVKENTELKSKSTGSKKGDVEDKEVVRVICFYRDGSFDSYLPSEE